MEPFKNLINETAARKIAKEIKKFYPDFEEKKFLNQISQELEPLELKNRTQWIAEKLSKYLPNDPKKSFPILVKTLKSEKNQNGLEGFIVWPLTHFIDKYGQDHVELSLLSLKEMTKVFTAEFAVRNFLIHHQTQTLRIFKIWLKDENEHVRRLLSEGTRPLLPWGQKIPAFLNDPTLTRHLLEQLKEDSSPYVLKSVSNHLNDHSKKNEKWLIDLLKRWKKENPQSNTLNKIIKHALRTLIKKGHPEALKLIGISQWNWGKIETNIKSKQFQLGDFFEAEVVLKNPTHQKISVVIDHEFHFLKSNQTLSPKVFKGTTLELKPNETRSIELRMRLKKVTTRTYYPGKQSWCLMINGHRTSLKTFTLKL